MLLTVFTISVASEDVASTERTTFAVEGNVSLSPYYVSLYCYV